jgi:hypothetical protein
MLKKLEHQLNVITGFAGTTLQPNSGAQGEYAGLMTMRTTSQEVMTKNICLFLLRLTEQIQLGCDGWNENYRYQNNGKR